MTESNVALLHLCDSLFPIGSFAHSDGLEAATSSGHIQTPAQLLEWMTVTLSIPLRRLEGPAVARAWRAFHARDFASIKAIDDETYALRPSSAGRDSTRAMGTRLLKTWQRLRPDDDLQRLLIDRESFTLPVAFGLVSAASDIAIGAAVEGFIYTRLAAVVSAAMRLMPLGQHDGHVLLTRSLEWVPGIADDILKDDRPLHAFAPALDIASMSQQYGHSRLFRS